MAELKTYVLSKLFWDPSLNDTALVHDFINGYYGPAAGSVREYMEAFVETAAPSAAGKGKERRFVVGACVQVEARPWAAGGKGVVTTAHPDGTYSVNMSTAEEPDDSGGPAHPDVVSWVYLQPCDGSRSEDQARADGRLLVDMAAVSTQLLPSRLCACLVNEQLTGHRCNHRSRAGCRRTALTLAGPAATSHLRLSSEGCGLRLRRVPRRGSRPPRRRGWRDPPCQRCMSRW